jgi:hypothetical protein
MTKGNPHFLHASAPANEDTSLACHSCNRKSKCKRLLFRRFRAFLVEQSGRFDEPLFESGRPDPVSVPQKQARAAANAGTMAVTQTHPSKRGLAIMSAASTVPQAAPLSEGARIVNTFVAPTKTFTDINRKASWIIPWLLMAVVSLLVAFSVQQKIGWAQVNENQLRLQPKRMEALEKAPPDQRALQQKIGIAFTAGITYAWPVVRLIGLLLVALVLWFSFKFFAGADVGFGKSLAVSMYASLPIMIKGILVIAFLWGGMIQPDQFISQNPIGTNFGAFFKPGTPMYALGSSIDLFEIWILCLAAIGFTCVSKAKRGAAFGIVFGWYAVLTLIGVGAAAIF